jgi:hypothetical protein
LEEISGKQSGQDKKVKFPLNLCVTLVSKQGFEADRVVSLVV